jgi:outer membrane autotransporter protein
LTMLQFGTDLYRSEASKGDSRFGLLATMGEGRATFIDGERALAGLGLLAGEVEMDFKGAGMYWTSHRERGGYLDVTGQLVHYQNEYRDLHLAGGEQKGWGGTVSAELGAAYSLGNSGWKAEPSIQIVYQQLELDGFQDGISSVSAVDEDALRTRAGVQLFRTAGDWLGMSNASPYVALGVEQDVLDPESVSIGATAITEELPSTTVDLGAGFMGQVKAGFQLHFDLRYQRAIEGEKDGMRANFGFRKQF